MLLPACPANTHDGLWQRTWLGISTIKPCCIANGAESVFRVVSLPGLARFCSHGHTAGAKKPFLQSLGTAELLEETER